jgi:hypothetical protein
MAKIDRLGVGYPSMLTAGDLLAADAVCTAGVPAYLGAYTVQAGEAICLGIGQFASFEAAAGRIYADMIDDAAGAEAGILRLSIWSAQNKPLKILKEFHTSQLKTSATDLTKQMPLPEQTEMITEDKKLVVEFISAAADTIDVSACTLQVPITKYEVL